VQQPPNNQSLSDIFSLLDNKQMIQAELAKIAHELEQQARAAKRKETQHQVVKRTQATNFRPTDVDVQHRSQSAANSRKASPRRNTASHPTQIATSRRHTFMPLSHKPTVKLEQYYDVMPSARHSSVTSRRQSGHVAADSAQSRPRWL